MKWKLIGSVILLMGLVTTFFILKHAFINQGRFIEKEICNAEKIRAINENIKIKEKSDNVILPSELIFIEQLRDKSF